MLLAVFLPTMLNLLNRIFCMYRSKLSPKQTQQFGVDSYVAFKVVSYCISLYNERMNGVDVVD